MFTINIQNIGGIFYINGKRLGHDTLLPEELQALDEFIREYKHTKNALLISKAPEILEKLKECIDILDVKCTDGCINKTWIDFQNGNGEDIGIEIDRFIKETKQLIKEATEL